MGSAGLNAVTGRPLLGWEHTKQSIRKILETAIGERIQRAKVGSRIEEHIDRPQNISEILDVYVDTAEAIELRFEDGLTLGEPRFKITHVAIYPSADGAIAFEITGIEYPNGHKGDFTPGQSPRTMSFATQYFGT